MIESVVEFHKKWNREIILNGEMPISEDLKLESRIELPWYCFDLPNFPKEKILNEIKVIKDQFVPHRKEEGNTLWSGICLHGLDRNKTMCPEDYGIDSALVKYSWTDVAELCPTAKHYFSEVYPAQEYHRIRFMLIEPGGFILPHRDRDRKGLRGPLTIPLNTPNLCDFVVEGYGRIPFEAGKGHLIDLSNRHSVWNQSSEDRYHIIAEAHYKTGYKDFLKLIARSHLASLSDEQKNLYKNVTSKLGL